MPYADFPPDFVEGQGDMNRAQFVNLLASEWLPAMPDVDEGLPLGLRPSRGRGLRDGLVERRDREGVSRRARGRIRPRSGLDRPRARGRRSEGVTDRVDFQVRDAADPELADRYDLVTVFEAVHDMAKPVEALGRSAGCSRRAASRWSRTRESPTSSRRPATTSSA